MMISPETYYEERLKGKSAKEILTVIRGLKQKIGKLKNVVEHPNYELRLLVAHPTEKVQISCNQAYLERAKDALTEAGGIYIPSAAEQKAMEFNDNIPYIEKIVFSIGGFFNGFETKTFTIDGNKVKAHHNRSFTSKKPNNDECEKIKKEAFFEQLKSLNIGEWRRKYDTLRFNIAIMDGTQWDLEIYYSNGRRPVKIHGDNAYPYNFARLLDLFEIVYVEYEL
jgi:hypothetical protein